MNNEQRPLRAVSWRDLCPWLIIFRVYRHAVRLPVLFLATTAVLLTPLGWRLGEWLFLREDRTAVEVFSASRDAVGNLHRWPGLHEDAPSVSDLRHAEVATRLVRNAAGEMVSVYHGLWEPFRQCFDYRWQLPEFAFFLLGGLWTLAVWSVAGGAITRLAIVPLACDQHLGLRAALGHAIRKFPAYFLAPLFPLLGAVLIGAGLALVGLLLRGGEVNLLIAGGLWFLVVLGGFALAYLLLGLLFGWPLMWAAASAERNPDFFESVSRAYSYTRQAALPYLFYAVVAALYGGLCWLLVQLFAEAVVWLGAWGVSWGAGRDRMLQVYDMVRDFSLQEFAAVSGAGEAGVALIAAWIAFVRTVATAFAFSFFWCAVCAIYLLLRYHVDRREMDEVWFELQTTAGPPRVAAAGPIEATDPATATNE